MLKKIFIIFFAMFVAQCVDADNDTKDFKTREKLIKEIELSFETGDWKRFSRLSYGFDSIDKTKIDNNRNAFIFSGAGKHKVIKIDILDSKESIQEVVNKFEAQGIAFPIVINAIIILNTEGNEGFKGTKSKGTLKVLVGEKEGNWYILL